MVGQNRPLQIGLDGSDFYKEITCKLEINDGANDRFFELIKCLVWKGMIIKKTNQAFALYIALTIGGL